MKRVYLSRLIKFIALVVPIVAVVLFCQNYLFGYTDPNTDRIQGFYLEEKNSLDVVFLGASEIHEGFLPGYAYEQHGFTSYSYSINANPGSLYTAQLKEILSTQNPQLILVEINGFLYTDNDRLSSELQLHLFTDNIPMSGNKISTILKYPYTDKLSCFFPFIKYHGNWRDLYSVQEHLYKTLLASGKPSLLNGAVTQTKHYDATEDPDANVNSTSSVITTMAETYLIEFLEYCQAQNLENIVFINFPRILPGEKGEAFLSRIQYVEEIVTRYGYSFLDLQDQFEAIGLDPQQDFYNTQHMNIYGQLKTTEYLGDLIVNHYQLIPMEQSSENKAHWENCARYAHEFVDYIDHCYQTNQVIWADEETFQEYLENQNP